MIKIILCFNIAKTEKNRFAVTGFGATQFFSVVVRTVAAT